MVNHNYILHKLIILIVKTEVEELERLFDDEENIAKDEGDIVDDILKVTLSSVLSIFHLKK